MNKHLPLIVFSILLVGLFIAYDYHNILFKRPQGIHQWRQADCMSITHNFYTGEADFLKPRIHNQSSENGYAISEFPVLYQLNAVLWKLFGKHEWISRLTSLIITIIGLFALFRVFRFFVKNVWLAMIFSLLAFTSTVYGYYANNFLTNVPAMSLAIIGLERFLNFIRSRKKSSLMSFFIIFCLAGLLKATSLFIFFLIASIILYSVLFPKQDEFKLRKHIKELIIGYALVFIVLGLWYGYASWFNAKFNSGTFLVGILPIWELGADEVTAVWEEFKTLWSKDYMKLDVLLLVTLATIASLVRQAVIGNKLLLFGALITLLGLSCYLALWFQVYDEHDYYLIDAYIVVILSLIVIANNLDKVIGINRYLNAGIFLFLTAVLVHSAIDSQYRIRLRYRGWMNSVHEHRFMVLEDIEPKLRELGLEPGDLIISVPDESINTTLYLVNQKGWTEYGGELNSAAQIEKKISIGAKYLFVNDSNYVSNSMWAKYTTTPVFSKENLTIYSL